MKVIVDAEWDEEAGRWVAVARGDLGLVTEASTIEELRGKLAIMLPDLMDGAESGLIEVDLVARSTQTIQAA